MEEAGDAVKQDVATLCRNIEEKAKQIIHQFMPQKILELEKIHKVNILLLINTLQ